MKMIFLTGYFKQLTFLSFRDYAQCVGKMWAKKGLKHNKLVDKKADTRHILGLDCYTQVIQ
jgi:hypothetical protein